MKHPVQETWRFLDDPGGGYVVTGEQEIPVLLTSTPHGTWQHAELAAAAPEMLRALLMVEELLLCVGYRIETGDCINSVDAALAKAGLKTQEQRDQARKALGL